MPADIRSFFAPKGAAAPKKPAAKEAEEPAKSKRGSMLSLAFSYSNTNWLH